MKFSNRKYQGAFALVELLIIICILALLAAISIPKAQAQITQSTLGGVTNLPAVITATVASNTVSFIDINNNSGLALSWKFNVSSGTSAGGLFLFPSMDKTNYDTVPWVLLRNASGTTDQIATTNWDANKLRGYQSLMVGTMTNANAGTLTNKGITFGRPNS